MIKRSKCLMHRFIRQTAAKFGTIRTKRRASSTATCRHGSFRRQVPRVDPDIVVRAFPPLEAEHEAEYIFLSRYFFRPLLEESKQQQRLESEDYLLREIVHKRIDRQKDMVSFALVSQRELGACPQQNPYNRAGYRYFVGVVLEEINSEMERPLLGQTVYFFESSFPFNSVLRDALVGVFGKIQIT